MSTTNPADLDDVTEATRRLRARMSPERWAIEEARAREAARIIEEVDQLYSPTMSRRRALAEVAPGVGWSAYLHWRRRAERREGAPWERQLDGRVPPQRERLDDAVVAVVKALRLVTPSMSCEEAREHLVRRFGPERGAVSDAALKRIWKAAGLALPRGRPPGKKKEAVTHLNGGAAMAMLGAAAAETGVIDALAHEMVEGAKAAVSRQEGAPESSPSPGREERDDRGRFTGAYNRAVRGEDGTDPRWDSDGMKRQRTDLSTLAASSSSEATLGAKLMAVGATALLTERRGFDGLEGPAGAWLSALGIPAYQPATLDKFLGEIALLDLDEQLWTVHARQWSELTLPWRDGPEAPPWARCAVYVDATQDPYWTRSFASAGKVSRVARKMPCLSKIAVMGGPGVPLVVETHAGGVSLKSTLLPCLDRVAGAIGDGELGRLVIVDAEMGTVPLMRALSEREDTWFVTVLKGSTAKAAKRGPAGEWERFRERDLIREVPIRFEGGNAPEGGLDLRGVEMIREGSRNPVTTTFITNAPALDMPSGVVPAAYLSRWPNQERRFRDGRNGIGLERSHGYGGSEVTNVALITATEKASGRVERARTRVATLRAEEEAARRLLDAAERGQRTAARAAVRAAEKATREAARKLAEVEAHLTKLTSTPREIYVRDTTRDSIATLAKMTVLMLLEFVLKEYLGGVRMEPRSFIEAFMYLPVTIRETEQEIVHELHVNQRSSRQAELVRHAAAEISRRELRRGKKRLKFVAVEGA